MAESLPEVSKNTGEDPQRTGNKTVETRLSVVLQASMTTAIIAATGYIKDDNPVVLEVLRSIAPFFGLLIGVFTNHLIKKYNFNEEEKRLLKYINDSPNETEREFWRKRLLEHRSRNSSLTIDA